MSLTALKVRILLKKAGGCLYPDFNSLSFMKNRDPIIPWTKYVDIHGGWKYDRTSGHQEESDDSPRGEWHGMILVDDDFATEAIATFPTTCFKLADADAKTFYEDKITVYDNSQKIVTDRLLAIKAKQDLSIELTPEETKMLDPNDPMPGITLNKHKTWADHKGELGVSISAVVGP